MYHHVVPSQNVSAGRMSSVRALEWRLEECDKEEHSFKPLKIRLWATCPDGFRRLMIEVNQKEVRVYTDNFSDVGLSNLVGGRPNGK